MRECLALVEPLGRKAFREFSPKPRSAREIRADRDYPAEDLSMMDGYAVGPRNRESYRVEGETDLARDREKSWVRIRRAHFYRSRLPPGATRVVPQELVQREAEHAVIRDWAGE